MCRKFRVHHSLCTALYRGEGYSGAFCENMTNIVTSLRANPKERLCLVTEPDMICEKCPNRTEENGCRQDADHVKVKDLELLGQLGLTEGAVYTYEELLRQVSAKLSREMFEAGCAGCKWYQMELCTYEKLKTSILSSY